MSESLRARAVAAVDRAVPGVAGPARRLVRSVRTGRTPAIDGVNVVGYHHIESGLASNARELVTAFRAAGVPCVEIDNDLSSSPTRRSPRPVPDELYDTTIAVVTAFEFPYFCHRFPQLRGPGKRLVGYWVWEVEEIPEQHLEAVPLVDAVWTTTRFVERSYRAAAPPQLPVHVAPLRMEEPDVDPAAVAFWRSRFGEDVTVFVTSFDYLSIYERKNPAGAIRAFRRAFGHGDEPVRLVVKSLNGDQRPDDVARLVDEIGGDPRIELLDTHLGEREHVALIAAADVLVSLHRSEGFGLHPALGMWVGTPVVTTAYGGVLDFVDASCAALVDATEIPVTNGQGIYPDTAVWAAPDLDQAAMWLRRLAADGELAGRLAANGRRRIERQPSYEEFGRAYAAMLAPTAPTDEPFFTGLDAARGPVGMARRWWADRREASGSAWPDTARR